MIGRGLDVGEQVDRYEVVRLLGAGAMARVYEVRHVALNAPCAMKVLQVAHGSICERMLREGRVQASLRHRNVVSVMDTLVVDGLPALVMELVDGPDLDRFIQERSPIPLDLVLSLGEGVVKGVRAAHRAGHLHRDLKPANVLVSREDDEWVPRVADFGLTKALGDPSGPSSATRTGQVMGSPAYMAPEQARDAKGVDVRADVFSLGCILYELVTGERAFDGPDYVATLARIATGAYVPVRDLRPDLPVGMAEAIEGSLVVDREARIPDCDTLLAVWRGERGFEVTPSGPADTMAALLGPVAGVTLAPSPSITTLGDGSTVPAPPPPSSHRGWLRGTLLLAGAVVAGGCALALGLGVGAVGLLAVGDRSEPSPAVVPEDAPGAPSPVPEALAEPLQTPSQPEDVAPPPVDRRAAVPPTPVPRRVRGLGLHKAPTPVVVAPSPVVVAPSPVEEPPVSTAVQPPPAPVAMGEVRVEGTAREVWLLRDGERYAAGAVPVGTYRILAGFSDAAIEDQGLQVLVPPKGRVVVHCDGLGWRCVRR
ncbi:MAG: protein kinase [Alphaproteobacteria bacterium]|nr:protein kinase [Alphaproteobacteria bacterium]